MPTCFIHLANKPSLFFIISYFSIHEGKACCSGEKPTHRAPARGSDAASRGKACLGLSLP